jgi:hypothetical protein
VTQSAAGLEYPEQSYYPRWKIRLILRFSEFGALSTLQNLAPTKPTRSLSGTDLSRGVLKAVPDPQSPPGATRFLLQAPGGDTSVRSTFGPQARKKSKDGLTQVIEGLVPIEFQLASNGLRTASSLHCKFPFIGCPIDPRTLRACAVEFFLGCVTAQEASLGNVAGGSPSLNANAQPLDVLPDTWTDIHGQPRTNKRFQGWVDVWEISWSRGPSTISLECTDNTRLLLNLDAPAKGQVSKDLPLDQAIAKYLTFSPIFEGLSVEYRPSNETAPTLAQVMHSSAFTPGQGPPLSLLAGGHYEKASVFDYLTDVCRSVGHSLYMDGTTLVIQRVRSMTSASVQSRPNDPYLPRTLPSGQQMPYRRWIYGRNITSLRLKRNMGRRAPANISVRAYNPDTKETIVERYPLAKDAQVMALPGDNAENKWLELTIGGGIVDRKTMRIFAQEVYESLWRQEVAVEIETRNFSSFGGGNSDPDLLDLAFGDPLEILFARDDFYSSLSSAQRALDAKQANAQFLIDAGFPPAFANDYAAVYTNAGLQSLYRSHQIDIEGHREEGVKFKIEAVNYVEVTSDKSLDTGEEPPQVPPAQPASAPKSPPPPAGPTPPAAS